MSFVWLHKPATTLNDTFNKRNSIFTTTNNKVIINDILSQTINKNKATLGCGSKENVLNAIGFFCHTRIIHVHAEINKHT